MKDNTVTISNDYFVELLRDSMALEEVKIAYSRFDKYDLDKMLAVILDTDSYEVLKERKEALKKALAEKENN